MKVNLLLELEKLKFKAVIWNPIKTLSIDELMSQEQTKEPKHARSTCNLTILPRLSFA